METAQSSTHAFAWAPLFVVLLLLLSAPAISFAAPAPPSDPKDHLQQILQRPLYQRWKLRQEHAQAADESSFSQRIHKMIADAQDWLWAQIEQWLNGRHNSGLPSAAGSAAMIGGVLKLLAWIALAVALALIAVFLYRALRDRQSFTGAARVLSREHVRRALEEGQALALESPQWLAEADRLALEKDPRAVYRALYLALLAGLHSAGKIDFRPTRTNWIYVDRFRGPVPERDLFSDLTRLFDLVWYGHAPAEASRIEEVKHTVASLLGQGANRASDPPGRPARA
jgi:hypothetical protein